MQTSNFELKPNPHIVELISKIEYLRGKWDKLAVDRLAVGRLAVGRLAVGRPPSTITLNSNKEVLLNCILETKSTFLLEPFSSPSNDLLLEKSSPLVLELLNPEISGFGVPELKVQVKSKSDTSPPQFIGLLLLLTQNFPASTQELKELYSLATGIEKPTYRLENTGLKNEVGEIVFLGIQPNIIQARLNSLLKFTLRTGHSKDPHPLLKAGLFHLLFLQIYPFSKSCHRFSLGLIKLLLKNYGYSFSSHSLLIEFISKDKERYFLSLRQAEKFTFNTWSGINVWLEFFLETLLNSLEDTIKNFETERSKKSLTSNQKRILEFIKISGSSNREMIAEKTGIKVSTIKYNLSVLTTKGFLLRSGKGRATSYRVI